MWEKRSNADFGENPELGLTQPVVGAYANKSSSSRKDDLEHDVGFATSRCFGWDLNSNDVFYPYKSHDLLKSGDASECGSSTGPVEEKDPMRVWKEMKQNGFLSSSHGGIPVPKPRGRKSKSDGLKNKMEFAKREQVDRFATAAAPSGLLKELNPGIINHVRNSKQVHSIIEALVRSEKQENHHAGGKQAVSTKEISDKKEMEDVSGLGMKQPGHSHEDGSLSTLSWLSESVDFNSYHAEKDGDLSKVEEWIFGQTTCPSHSNHESGDNILALKLSSSTPMASENTSSLTNESSANVTSVSSLSVKAANVAFQWLELLHQDIKGRLSALIRSKKRVRSVIHTELPFLISREFSCNQENDPCVMKNSAARCTDSTNADVHQARWSALFDQMDKNLSEEEIQLETWLNQVKEMQLHCERGLQHQQYSALHNSRQSKLLFPPVGKELILLQFLLQQLVLPYSSVHESSPHCCR
ncbi:cation-transporting ATPase [Actinidia rufa]|uniref:Cation-transporting ATPase n=1 Tax=Actinidia rufa TaxID=165716 RepID=A0A7J0GWG6_9ERIC|nr:cation-transporting ATPase [Actinidia rufa]